MLKPNAIPLFLVLAAASMGTPRAQGPQADASSSPPARPAARVEVDVRISRSDEVRSRLGDSLLPPEAVGLFLLPQAVVTPATTADTATTSVIGPPGGLDFELPARTVLSQLAGTSLASDLAAQLREQMRAAPLEAGDAWSFEVAIAYFGLRSEQWRPTVQSETASYCLVIGGVASVSGLHGPLDTSEFRRGVNQRSDGMPEPECRPLSEYAANGGRLLREATRNMASVLAAWIVNRTLQYR